MSKTTSRVAGTFIMHTLEMRVSAAWQALPNNARRVLDRLEVEFMREGGFAKAKLTCTYDQFAESGIRRASVALAVRQCVALGFLEIVRRGHFTAADLSTPNIYRLSYTRGRWPRGEVPADPSDDWRKIATPEEAEEALKAAGDKRHADQARRRARAQKGEYRRKARSRVPVE